MKNLKLYITLFIITGSMQPIQSNMLSNNKSSNESIFTYLYSHLIEKETIIPLAKDAVKKTIIFDLDGVLCTTNDLQAFVEIGINTTLQYMFEHSFPTRKRLFKALEQAPAITTFDSFNEGLRMPQIMVDWQTDAQNISKIQTTMTEHITNSQLTTTEKNLQINTILMMTLFEKFIATRKIIPAGIELLHLLKQNGYKLYILSNWDPMSFPLFIKKFPEIFKYQGQNMFDGIMTSGQTGLIKPNKDIFEACLQKFNITASDAIFIDDTIENIQAAENLGIQSIHCKNKNIANTRKELIKQLQNN